MTTIITKNGSGVPTAGDLETGELAVDLTNNKLYTKNGSNEVVQIDGLVPEIGSFTPKIGTSSSSYSAVVEEGHYVKIGNICTVTFRVSDITVGSPTAFLYLRDLPFPALTTGKTQNLPISRLTFADTNDNTSSDVATPSVAYLPLFAGDTLAPIYVNKEEDSPFALAGSRINQGGVPTTIASTFTYMCDA